MNRYIHKPIRIIYVYTHINTHCRNYVTIYVLLQENFGSRTPLSNDREAAPKPQIPNLRVWKRGYLESQGYLVSILITPRSHIVTPVTPIINLLTKSSTTPYLCYCCYSGVTKNASRVEGLE